MRKKGTIGLPQEVPLFPEGSLLHPGRAPPCFQVLAFGVIGAEVEVLAAAVDGSLPPV